MNLSAITDEISQEFEHSLGVLREYGATGAELRGLWGTNIGELDREQVLRAKRALTEHDLAVSCLASPFYKCDLHSDERAVAGQMHLAEARGYDAQMDLLKRLCDLAHQFDTRFIRVFTFWRRGPMTADIEQAIVEAFAKPAEIAHSEDVVLLIENEHACYVGTGVEAARLVSTIGSPNVRVCWDPGNALCAGELPYPTGYEAIRQYADHVHIKDGVTDASGGSVRWTVVGDGEINYTEHFRALKRDGYTGYVSLETHYIPQDGTPEEGSRPCLAAIQRLIEGHK